MGIERANRRAAAATNADTNGYAEADATSDSNSVALSETDADAHANAGADIDTGSRPNRRAGCGPATDRTGQHRSTAG